MSSLLPDERPSTPGFGCSFKMAALRLSDFHVLLLQCFQEKVQREVPVMQFLEYSTNLRVPHILHYGMTKKSPKGLGPFIIMEYINNDGDIINAINTPGLSLGDRPILDPDVSQERLESVYGQMADIMLKVSKHSFPEIGCISKANETTSSMIHG